MGVIYIYIPTTSGAVKFSLEVETQVILVVSSNLGRFQELLIEDCCSKAFWEMHLPAPLPLSEE